MIQFATVVGIVASVVGIFVNIFQLRKSSRELDKLELEIEKLKRDVGPATPKPSWNEPIFDDSFPVTDRTIDPVTDRTIDPATGVPVEPAIGRRPAVVDPVTGRPIDLMTGRPIDPVVGRHSAGGAEPQNLGPDRPKSKVISEAEKQVRKIERRKNGLGILVTIFVVTLLFLISILK
jgi:hypothetical protein